MQRRIACIGLMLLLLGACAAPGAHAAVQGASVSATIGAAPTGAAIAPGYVGVSLEYGAMHVYTGRDWHAINPVLVRLLRNLAPGQTPVIRIGGNSSDATWWPLRRVTPPEGVRYRLTMDWLRTARALASSLGARLIMGVNLAAGRPAVAAAEARAILQVIGRRYLAAIEIGNEPDVYNLFPWYRDRYGSPHYARPPSYNLNSFIADFSRWRAALPNVPLAGPAFAELTDAWLGGLAQFIDSEAGLRIVTIHRYPLRACLSDVTSPSFASIPNLLSDQASAGLAQSVAPFVPMAHARGISFRVDETNSASCSGARNVSNTFASALWVLDTLFNFASVGVDGVNLHTLPGARYELFTFSHHRRTWQAFVHPEYYGMLMFEQAFPAGARLLPSTVSGPAGVPLKVWATRAPDGHTRVVLINKDTAAAHAVDLQLPGSAPASIEWLQAPAAGSTLGVTLGGQTFGSVTRTGTFPGPVRATGIGPQANGDYAINVPPASAALLTR